MKWRFPQIRRRFQYVPGLYTFRIAALVVLCAGLLITGLLWASSRQRINQDAFNRFSTTTDNLSSSISQRMQTYQEILRGSVGLFSSVQDVNHEQWHSFIENYQVKERYPGFAGIGYAKVLHPGDTDSYMEFIRSTYYPPFTIFPEGERDPYVVASYIESSTDTTRGLGFDIYSEPTRRAALNTARDTGRTAMTDSLTLLLDPKDGQQRSFLMYMPIYKQGMPVSTVAERQAAIDGFVYASFRMESLLSAVNHNVNDSLYSLQLYSGDVPKSQQLLYQTKNAPGLQKNPYTIMRTSSLMLPGKKWTAVYRAAPSDYISASESKRPLLTVISGIIFSITLASFLYMLMLSRARYISRTQQLEVQRAKDDLLSLASHQLRTPATGVKQYIGMVLEDYVGDITDEQRSMLSKAYESNERQLETINQILYVTRADSGRLKLTKRRFDIIAMIKDVVAEQRESIDTRDQKVKLKFHARKQMMYADPQYVRMAVENLVSNASKYSYEKSRINIVSVLKDNKFSLSVTDHGVGIDIEDMPKLFNKFSRIDNELSVKAGGSGIGLYLSKQIAQLHQGDITVASSAGQGSTFTLILPISKQQKKL